MEDPLPVVGPPRGDEQGRQPAPVVETQGQEVVEYRAVEVTRIGHQCLAVIWELFRHEF